MAAGLSCGSCGSQLSAAAKFCSECGTPLNRATQPAEYKQVTVLFADVVHSMDIAAAVGAERLREIMAELVDRSAAVVKRYGGTVDKFTGDGLMAVFGAPVALEDHAFRACLAALAIQDETARLAPVVKSRDSVDLQVRVGLNSGQVIAGDVGSMSLGYTAIGEQVGMAQRMESAAPPGGVMLSESTARLVEHSVVLAEPEQVRIKGADHPVGACRLLGIAGVVQPVMHSALVGRRWELAALEGMLDRSVSGQGCVVGVVGPAGIGKSRLVAETAALARSREIEVFSTYCESHTSDIPFLVAARLLRDVAGISGLDRAAGRAQVRTQVPDADPQDLLLLDDFLGIADTDVVLPNIDPDARRRRIAALINATTLARTTPAVVIVEDAHWIDEVSESILADFLPVVPQVALTVLITYRPEYRRALAPPGGQTVVLTPLSASESSNLVSELLGSDPSVGALASMIVARAAGNPFFAEEIVRDLAERGVLAGEWGSYVCRSDVADVSVPATLRAAIAARIDRLHASAKQTLNGAAVVGLRFSPDLLADLGIELAINDLVAAQLVDQVRFTPSEEYAFRHPLIRAVAYESQLKSDRAELHRRLAIAIEIRQPESADENAALIAEHLEAAGDLLAAYGWHMRAGAWSDTRDIAAARLNWERALQVADASPEDDPNHTAMRIAPRTLLCAHTWRVHGSVAGRFQELRELCEPAGDKASLAIGMTGLAMEHIMAARTREASRLATECLALLESLGDPTLIVGVAALPVFIKIDTGEMDDALHWCERALQLAGGDPTMGHVLGLQPWPIWLAYRGFARWALGIEGWRDDYDRSVAMARGTNTITHAVVIGFKYSPGIPFWLLLPDDAALQEIEEALQIAEQSADDVALFNARNALGTALVERVDGDRERGLEMLVDLRDKCRQEQFFMTELPMTDIYVAEEWAKHGECDAALILLRRAIDHFYDGNHPGCLRATDALVLALLNRGADRDVREAHAAVERLAAAPWGRLAIGELWVLRLRALLARADGDQPGYRQLRDHYRAMATSLGFEGHIAVAEAMP